MQVKVECVYLCVRLIAFPVSAGIILFFRSSLASLELIERLLTDQTVVCNSLNCMQSLNTDVIEVMLLKMMVIFIINLVIRRNMRVESK